MEAYEAILWGLLVVTGLGAAIIHFIRLSNKTAEELKKEMEAKKRPLTKIEIARKRAANKATKNKGSKK